METIMITKLYIMYRIFNEEIFGFEWYEKTFSW